MIQNNKIWIDKALRLFILMLILVLSPVGNIRACNVPVFRYALERWPADNYQLQIYYEHSFDKQVQKLLDGLLNKAHQDSLINLNVVTRDMAGAGSHSYPELPWMELAYPEISGIRGVLWSGPFNAGNIKRIISSPTRSAFAERLTGGEAAVWLLLEVGDEDKDRTAGALLDKSLHKMSDELSVPDTGYDTDGNEIQVDDFQDYDVRFSMIRLSRKDPREEVLINMLLGSEEDLIYYEEPIAFPVFGRGRALYGLVGAGINEKTVSQSCQSIVGWCSCEIKALNPGIDLLVENDWSNPAGGKMVKTEPLPQLTGVSAFIENKTENEKPAVEKQGQTLKQVQTTQPDSMKVVETKVDTCCEKPALKVEHKQFSPLLRNTMLVLGLGFIFMAGLTFVIMNKRNKF